MRQKLALAFLIGATVVVDVPIAGRLMGPDILCVFGLAWLFHSKRPLLARSDIRLFSAMCALWFFGAFVTDLIRMTPAEDVIRGWSKLILFLVVFLYLASLARDQLEPLVAFLAGLYVGSVAKLFILPVYGFADEPWKFGYGPAVTFFALLVISSRRFYEVFGVTGQAAMMLAMGAANLVGNSRAVFGLILASMVIAVASAALDRLRAGHRLSIGVFLVCLAGGGILYQGISVTYSYLAANGILGQQALDKYQEQERLGLGLLLGGRVESLVSTRAIADSPIIGHGSWAVDVYYSTMLVEELRARGEIVRNEDPPPSGGVIPSHSYLFGAWVESGMLGGAFWIYVLCLSVLGLYASFHVDPRLRPLIVFTVMGMLWNVLFSPFGAERRFFVPVELLILLWAIRAMSAVPRRQVSPMGVQLRNARLRNARLRNAR